MEKDLKVFDIGNHVWCSELTVGRDAAGEPVVMKFYGLSEESARAKALEHEAAQKKRPTLRVNVASEEHVVAPVALAVNDGVSDTTVVKKAAKSAVKGAEAGKDGNGGSSAYAEKAARSVDIDLSVPCKVIPIRGRGEITYVVDGEPPEDELADDDTMCMSGRIADVIILKYAETKFDTVNDRPTGVATSKLNPDWEERLHDELAEGLPGGDMTVTELCGKWLEEKARRGASEKEIYRRQEICVFYILPVMGDALCRDVDRRHAERAAIRMLYRKDNSDRYGKRNFMSSSTTAKLKLAILNDLLEYGWSSGCILFRLHAQVNIREV